MTGTERRILLFGDLQTVRGTCFYRPADLRGLNSGPRPIFRHRVILTVMERRTSQFSGLRPEPGLYSRAAAEQLSRRNLDSTVISLYRAIMTATGRRILPYSGLRRAIGTCCGALRV